jgi:DNA-binding winged helix-turn-helix (wHTH) protein
MALQAAAFRFGPFVLDAASFRLWSMRGDAVLSPKALDLLLMFVQQPARLFTKDEIFCVLWPDVAVTDNALTQIVSEIRRALGDTPSSARYLQTLARRGYRFVAPVAVVPAGACAAAPRPAPGAASAQSPKRRELRSITVQDFMNVTGDRAVAWLSLGIAETLTSDLRALGRFSVIERSGSPSGWGASEADLVVVGSFQRIEDRLRITARVVDVVTREAIAHAKADGGLPDIFALQDAIAKELAASLVAGNSAMTMRRQRRGRRAEST